MLIDCHVHLNNYYTEEGRHPRPTRENVERLFREMEEHGVDHAVVLTSYLVNVQRPAVEEILEILRTQAAEGIGVVVISDDKPELLQTCGRVLLLKEGHLVQEIDTASVTEDELSDLILGDYVGIE